MPCLNSEFRLRHRRRRRRSLRISGCADLRDRALAPYRQWHYQYAPRMSPACAHMQKAPGVAEATPGAM
jgi:hypothetical protein